MDDSNTPRDSDDLIIRKGTFLPHWTLEGAIYHVCFRLADALPPNIREQFREIPAQSGRSLGSGAKKVEKLFSTKVERLLDAGYGACHLANPEIATLVRDSIEFLQGRSYNLHAWCIMPNHVHVMVEMCTGRSLASVVHGWKSYTAHQANKVLGRSGAFWQRDYYNRIIRNEREYLNQLRYVWNNPEQIGESDWPWRWIIEQ